MTRDEVRATAKRVTQWHERFAGLFGRREPQGHSLVYLKGLMSDQKRKSVEPIALQFARGPDGAAATQNEVVALQGFLTFSPWEVSDVFQEIQAVFAEELMPTATQWSLGTVGVIDESGFEKAGTESVGVGRQWCGRLGKTENCQVGVFLVGVTPGGAAALDAQLFLTEEWIADRKRRKKSGVPKEIKFQTKPQIAAEMIQRSQVAKKVRFDWIIADALYGDSGEFMDTLEARHQRYLLEVKKTSLVWTVDPATLPGKTPGPKKRKKLGSYRYHEVRSVQEIAVELPAEAWRPLKLREGSNGPLVFEFAVLRVWAMRHNRPGPPIWLVIRRSLDGKDVWYYVSNAEEETPWQTLAMVTGTRIRVEEYFEDGKMHLGMADYEARAWRVLKGSGVFTNAHPPSQTTDRSKRRWPKRNLEPTRSICILKRTTARGRKKACATSPAIVRPFVRSRLAPAPATPHPYAGVGMSAAQNRPSAALPFFGRTLGLAAR